MKKLVAFLILCILCVAPAIIVRATPQPTPCTQCDVTMDGAVSLPDVSFVLSHVGETFPVRPTPVRVRVVGFADKPIPAGAVQMVCSTFVPDLIQWFGTAQRTIIPDCSGFTSSHNFADVGPQDDCGQGFSVGTFRSLIEYGEMHLNVGGLNNNQWRNWIVVIGGGGAAQTSSGMTLPPSNVGDNFATATVGDWALTYALTGSADPCCVTHDINGPADCVVAGPGGSFSQEAINTMNGGGFYNTDTGISYPQPLTTPMVNALHDAAINGVWLR